MANETKGFTLFLFCLSIIFGFLIFLVEGFKLGFSFALFIATLILAFLLIFGIIFFVLILVHLYIFCMKLFEDKN